MNFDEILCSYCYNFYNLADRIPLLIPTCKHTFCSSCLQSFLTKAALGESFICPKDKQPVPLSCLNLTQFPENVGVIKTLEQRSKTNSNAQTPTLSPTKYSASSPIFNKTFDDYKFTAVQDSPMSLVSGITNQAPMTSNLGTIFTKVQTASQSQAQTQELPQVSHLKKKSSLMKLENYIQTLDSNTCKEHGRKLEYVCLNHHCRVCANCAVIGVHRGHDIKLEEDVYEEIMTKADKLVEILKDIESSPTIMPQNVFIETFNRKIQEKTRELQSKVHQKFEEYITMIKAREERIINEIKSRFSVLEVQLQAINQHPVDLKSKVNIWKEKAQSLVNIIGEKAEKGEIIYELLDQETPMKPDLIKEGNNLILDLKKKQEMPTDILDRELKKFSLTFSNNFESNIDSLCMFIAPEFNNSKSKLEDSSQKTNKFEMDNRMSFQRRYTTDNNLLNFDWQELPSSELQTPKKQQQYQANLFSNEKLDSALGFESNNNYLSHSYVIHQDSPDVGGHALNKTTMHVPNQSQNFNYLKVPKLEMEIPSHDNLRGSKVSRTPKTATVRASNARSTSPLSAHETSKGDISVRISTVKRRSVRVPEKYQIVLEGIRANKIESADLFDADLGDNGAVVIAEYLKSNNTLRQLKLVKNKISDEGGLAIVQALYHNNTLENLHLSQNLLTEKTIEAFVELFKTKRSIRTIFFNRNCINLRNVKTKAAMIMNLGINISL